jgi:hypothetical protein
MVIVALKNTTKLVKGARYEVYQLNNSTTTTGSYRRNRVWIKGLGGYDVKGFSDTNGNPLPQIDIKPTFVEIPKLEFESLKKGDLIVCNSNGYKTLVPNAKYKITDLKVDKVEYTSWNGTKGVRNYPKVKFEGVNRWFDFSYWKFRGLSTEEIREISLSQVLEGKDPEIIKTDKLRKIDHVKNKDKELILYLSKAIFDSNRNNMDIIGWASKMGSKMGIERKDYDYLLNLPLKEIIEKFEN